jgi:hypothetical protein
MKSLETPAIILREKPKSRCEDRYIVTYEYNWSEHATPKSNGTDLAQIEDDGMFMPVQRSWTGVTICIASDGLHGETH